MQLTDLFSMLGFAAGPFLFTAMAALLGWLYRLVMWPTLPRGRRQRSRAGTAEGHGISVKHADAVVPAPAGSDAAHAREDADQVNARVRWAHVGAWLVYAAVVSTLFVTFTNHRFGWPTRFAIGYAVLAPQLLILLWAIKLPIGRRALIFLLYAVVGIVLLRMALKHPEHVWTILWYVSLACVLIPIPGLLFLFIRRNQPFLLLLIAIAGYFMGTGLVLDRLRYSATVGVMTTVTEKPWLIAAGLAIVALGVIGAWLLVRQPRQSLRALAVVAGGIAAVLLDRDVAQHYLPDAVRLICFAALSVLQVLIIWWLFKGFVWLGQRRFLTPELVQVHLCWAFLTAYFVATTIGPHDFYSDRLPVRWGVVVALVLFILTLHLLLIRIYLRRPPIADKRLLLLRVFGRPNEREDLLDDLDDTWRRIGAVDLLAGSDVASRTLESRMLEAFLLRRSDNQFLRTKDDVTQRLEQRRSRIEGDARYPMNAFFCHVDIWWEAFASLEERADVVMMDVRGFTTSNEGCVRELTYLVRHPQRRTVLVADSSSDLQALGDLARAQGAERDFTVLDFSKQSKKHRRALFELLLNAANA